MNFWDNNTINIELLVFLYNFLIEDCDMSRKCTHEEFMQKFSKISSDIDIVGKYINARTPIACRCKNNLDHPIFYRAPDALLRRTSKCPYCNNIKVIGNNNDYLTRNPQIHKYIKDIDKLDRNTINSSSRVICVCPDCGFEKESTLANLVSYGLSCNRCGISNSLPNRILASLLAIRKDYIEESKLEFCKPFTQGRVYDAYIKIHNIKYLIEMDGIQHFGAHSDSFFYSYAEQKSIDDLKDEIVNNNEFKIIRINCKKSDFDYIKTNLLSSKLNDLLDLSNIDWTEVEAQSTTNYLKKVCNFYNENYKIKTKLQIQQELNISNKTLNKYLLIGYEIGWVKKPLLIPDDIIIIDKSGNEIGVCKSEAEAANFLKNLYPEFKWHTTGVSKVITGTTSSYHGFTFKKKEKIL